MIKPYFYIVFIIFAASCMPQKEDRIPVAKVNKIVLYYDEIDALVPRQLSKEDSTLFVKSYVNKWANEQLLLEKANINLQEEKEDINVLVEQYRQDLLINKYKEAVVNQELDTVVTQVNIDSFYQENKEIFRLNEELIKLRYIYFGKEVINPKELKSLFRDDKNSSDKKIIEHELELKSFNLNDSIWIKYEEVLKQAEFLQKYRKNQVLRKKIFFQNEEKEGIYLVQVKDVLLRNDIAPVSYALPTIKQMILHKRKLNLLRKIEETLIEDAIKNKEFRIY